MDQTVKSLAEDLSYSLEIKNTETFTPHISADGLNNTTGDECLSVPVPVSDMCEVRGQSGPVCVCEEDIDVMGDELDSLLDSMTREDEAPPRVTVPRGLLSFSSSSACVTPAFISSTGSRLNTLDSFTQVELDSLTSCDALDALDFICPPQITGSVSLRRPLAVGGDTLDSLSEFTLPGGKVCPSFLPSVNLSNLQDPVNPHPDTNGHVTSGLSKNPLEQTHDFIQACRTCFISTGSGVLDFEFRCDMTHTCKKDILLCKRRGGANFPWRRVRSRPTFKNFLGAFMLCREVLENQVCKYGEDCTFAYCQEEIDVWTQERRGLLIREQLFRPSLTNEKLELSVMKLLNVHTGMFMFLCEACFNYKPRIISKRRIDNPALCANTQTQHQFDKLRCLVHVVKNTAVCYSKIRAVTSRCQLDMCRHELSFGCKKQNDCVLSHSLIELQVWRLQRETGMTPEDIVNESKKHWNKQQMMNISYNKPSAAKCKTPIKALENGQRALPVQGTRRAESSEVKGYNLVMKFVCGQCWKDGLVSEPDRALKYCSAKARHGWTKDRRILLVKSQEKRKWVSVRPLPFAKTFPQKYDICVHVLKQRRCSYNGNCTFAHSEEEKDLWTYMKNSNLKDIQQAYDHWLSTVNQNRLSDGPSSSQSMEEKQITMPTDFAETLLDSFYCYLCGKHSNSERQWLQHITSEKHKNRVFSGEGEEESLDWTYRFPGRSFSLCQRLEEGCPDGVSCDFAHSEEELQEWFDRQEFIRRRLNKARADRLISPTDNNFGNYSFLLPY